MNDLLPIPIFPQGSLANSVITTVWVGVLVTGFFNLRLGWVLSGLVVPGYLAPLIIAKPWAAVAVGIEAVVTYLLVWFYSERLLRWAGLGGFFGRDRFFAMVLGSILVRLVFDIWLFPLLGAWANDAFRLQFDYRSNLHSFGLIIVSLLANQFWKTGLIRGLPPVLITVGLTWFLVRHGLMEFTNFSISNLSYMYEDVATSMLASPKSYIILITASFIASRMNLLYGWDFNGILIPSLLALQWYQPDKILFSFVEALIILGCSSLILRLPFYQGVTVEGARKLMLFFNVGFVWKMLLGFTLIHLLPQEKVTDYFGFGYMLSTLMAIKMHDKEIIARLTRATLQVSLVAVAGATLMGFALTFVTMPLAWSPAPLPSSAPPSAASDGQTLHDFVRNEKLTLYQSRQERAFVPPLAGESDLLVEAMGLLNRYVDNRREETLRQAGEALAKLNYHIRTLKGGYLLAVEGTPRRGWGSVIFNLAPASALVVEVPAPLDEWGVMDAGAWIFQQSGGRVLLMAGSRRGALEDNSSDVMRNRQTPFHLLHRLLAREQSVQVRLLGGEPLRVLTGMREAEQAEGSGMVWIKHTLPGALDVREIKRFAPDLTFLWEEPPLANVQREESRQGFAELFLGQRALRGILLQTLRPDASPRLMVEDRRIDGYLQEWLFTAKDAMAPRGSDLYQLPTLGDMLFWDGEILTPLIDAARSFHRQGEWTPEGLEALRVIGAITSRFGYDVVRYRHRGTGEDFLILAENGPPPRRHWGTYVMRLGEAREVVVQAPRSLYEGASFEFAVHLFEGIKARWLLIGGAHPQANRDGSADLMQGRAPLHLFNLIHQVILRQARENPMLTVQCRAFTPAPDRPVPREDILVAFRDGIRERERLPAASRELLQRLERDSLTTRLVDGSPETTGYEVGMIPQASYLDATRNKLLAVLWLAPEARRGFRQQMDNRLLEARVQALGLPTEKGDLATTLLALPPGDGGNLPVSVREGIADLQESGDIMPLHAALAERPPVSLRRFQDVNTGLAFLIVGDDQGRLLLAANLDPREPGLTLPLPAGPGREEAVRRFLDTRAGWLERGP